jgi:hypothetical protein
MIVSSPWVLRSSANPGQVGQRRRYRLFGAGGVFEFAAEAPIVGGHIEVPLSGKRKKDGLAPGGLPAFERFVERGPDRAWLASGRVTDDEASIAGPIERRLYPC